MGEFFSDIKDLFVDTKHDYDVWAYKYWRLKFAFDETRSLPRRIWLTTSAIILKIVLYGLWAAFGIFMLAFGIVGAIILILCPFFAVLLK